MIKALGIILKIILITLTLACMGALVMAYLSPCVDPATNSLFAFFGLFMPVIYGVGVVLLLILLLDWSRWSIPLLILLLIGIPQVSRNYKPNFSKQYHHSQITADLTILSYNVQGFVHDSHHFNADSIAAFVHTYAPDIICFQEFQSTSSHSQRYLDSLFSEWRYRESRDVVVAGGATVGLAVYSKLRIADVRLIPFDSTLMRSGIAMMIDLVSRQGDTIMLVNNHLCNTEINSEDIGFLTPRLLSTNADQRNMKFRDMHRKLSKNFKIRAAQADSIHSTIHPCLKHTIVCGDLNDTPSSYVYRQVRGHLNDCYVEQGSGYKTTFQPLYGMLSIDYIFSSKDFETVFFEAPTVNFSDHYPVVAKLNFKRNAHH